MSSDTRYIHNRAKLTKAEKIFFSEAQSCVENSSANESIS